MPETPWELTQAVLILAALLLAFIPITLRARITAPTYFRLITTALTLLGTAQLAGILDALTTPGFHWTSLIIPTLGIAIVIAALLWITHLRKRPALAADDSDPE